MPDTVPLIPLLPAFLQTIEEYTQEFLARRELKARTRRNMQQTAVQCLLFLQQKLKMRQLEKIERLHIEAFLQHLEACQYTAVTRQRKLKEVKTFFLWLKSSGHIPQDPAATIILRPVKPPSMRVLTAKEIDSLWTAVDNARDLALLQLLVYTGITLSEIHRLNMDDLILPGSQSVPGHSYLWATGRNDKRRLLQLDERMRATLAQWLEIRPFVASDAVFVSQQERRLSRRQIQYIVQKWGEEEGLPGINVKALRSTFAAHHLQSKLPVEYVQELMGIKLKRSMSPYTEVALKQQA